MISRPISDVYARIILNEYSEGFIKAQMERLKRSAGPHVTEEMMRSYIERFDQLKSGQASKAQIIQLVRQFIAGGQIAADPQYGPRDAERIKKLAANPLELGFYNWHDLEIVKDSFRDPADKKAQKMANPEDTGAELIYNDHGFQIYWAEDMNACIKFKQWITNKTAKSGETGNAYGWCISYKPSSNLYANYRFGKDRANASIYFVVDWNIPPSNPNHCIVLMALQDGRYRLSDATNNMSRETVTGWDTVVQWIPKIRDLKGLITFKPFSEAEELYNITRTATAADFAGYTRYNVKQAYIGAGKPINSEDYLKLPQELQHLYVNVRCPTPENDNLNLLLYGIFANTDADRVRAAIKTVRDLYLQKDPNYREPLLCEPTVMKGDNQTYKYYRKLVNDAIEAKGKGRRN
jgi:hypothetical protein